MYHFHIKCFVSGYFFVESVLLLLIFYVVAIVFLLYSCYQWICPGESQLDASTSELFRNQGKELR